ncbi:MAG TPA: glycoside hydrolase family 15 protein, partial [Candidatus Dormibacteraeota bacterium]|nr:glycoside hydrolase family 15 protein [Candidatus Dormibacteraeota bacterium]
MSDYPHIADHGLIGDLQTAALVATDGTIDWFCCPRFDSPSVFASLLDSARGGRFRIAPVGDGHVTRQLYLPDSASLITRFMTPDGVGEVMDLMPVIESRATAHHRIVRIIRVVRGELRFAIECEPRFDYGRRAHDVALSEHGAVFRTDDLTLTLSCSIPLERRGNDVRGEMTLHAGETAVALLESAAEGGPRRVTAGEMHEISDHALRFWRSWLARCTYRGRWWDIVRRSAIALKLMTYAPSGGLVAAPTMGLPEQVGGERNWDYRFTWVRDASLSVQALLGLGFQDEAAAYLMWLNDRANEGAGGGPSGPLQIMYRVDGSPELAEETLDHFEGYRGSRPVRVGNAAADQLQLDIYGELIDALYDADRHSLQMGYGGWRSVTTLIDWLGNNWDRPEEGIWETRGGRLDFVYGRLMSWVAMDRALRLADKHGLPADVDRLRATRDRIYEQVMTRGWNPRVGAFTQYYGSDVLDAAILQMPRVGFVVPTDIRWLGTLNGMRRELVSDSL